MMDRIAQSTSPVPNDWKPTTDEIRETDADRIWEQYMAATDSKLRADLLREYREAEA